MIEVLADGTHVLTHPVTAATLTVPASAPDRDAQITAFFADVPADVPQVVSARQAKLALLAVGLLDDADAAAVAAGRAVEIEWEYATEIRRENALIAALGAGIGLSEVDIDALFVAAAKL